MPRDPNRLAKIVVDFATRQRKPDRELRPKSHA
jgi:hypothetical protein